MKKVDVTIHGSFRSSINEMLDASRLFNESQLLNVNGPSFGKGEIGHDINGFAVCEGDLTKEELEAMRVGELDLSTIDLGKPIQYNFLQKMESLGREGVAYFINPTGKLGGSCALEVQFAVSNQIRTIFSAPLKDPPLYQDSNSVFTPEELIAYLAQHKMLPAPSQKTPWDNISTSPMVAYGGIVIDRATRKLVFVKTGTRGDKYTIVGTTAKNSEDKKATIARALQERLFDTSYFNIGEHITTFREQAGSYRTPQADRMFVDDEIFVDIPPRELMKVTDSDSVMIIGLTELLGSKKLNAIEPNAQQTLQVYAKRKDVLIAQK